MGIIDFTRLESFRKLSTPLGYIFLTGFAFAIFANLSIIEDKNTTQNESCNFQDGFMIFSKNIFLMAFILTSANAFALIDYSESGDSGSPGKSSAAQFGAKSMQRMPESKGQQRGLSWKADYSLITNYESIEIEGAKYAVLNVAAHIQTPADLFLEASYWNASGDTGSQAGNPRLILGFNWLRLGSPSEEARLNIYGGAKLSSSSQLGSGRTDKIFGAETTKRFGTFGLGIGYEMTLVGQSKRSDEQSIGNVNRLSLSGGWMVSNDIQFEVELENYNIAAAKNRGAGGLSEKISFSTLSPKLNLGLAPAVNLELGARFRMKKAKEETGLLNAGVFDLHGVHSNSLFAGLNLSI